MHMASEFGLSSDVCGLSDTVDIAWGLEGKVIVVRCCVTKEGDGNVEGSMWEEEASGD